MRELVKAMPEGHEFIYFGDYLRVPYGDKSPEVVTRFAVEIMDFLLAQGAELLVVACNTIVACAFAELTRKSPVPVVGVIGPAIEYLAGQGHEKVGVAATTATINSGIYEKSLGMRGIPSISMACPEFVPLIESNNYGPDLEAAIEKRFSAFVGQGLGSIVLGCTHFPIIQTQLENYLRASGEGDVKLIDPARHTAEYVRDLVESRNKDAIESSRIAEQPHETVKVDGTAEHNTKTSAQKSSILYWFGKVDVSLLQRASTIMGGPITAEVHALKPF